MNGGEKANRTGEVSASFLTSWCGDMQACIENERSLSGRQCHDWIEIQLGDLGKQFHHSRDANQHVFSRGEISGRVAPIAFKQSETPDSAHHLASILVGERSNSELNITEYLDMDSTEAERYQWPEQRIGCGSSHEFNTAGNHFLDDDAVHGLEHVSRGEFVLNTGKGIFNRGRVEQVQLDATDVALVKDSRRSQFQCHRKADSF